MKTSRLNQYQNMWVIVFFDLPTETATQRKQYSTFRKQLITDGFTMFQYSIYVRPCASQENADVHQKRVYSYLPDEGHICIMIITDRQFGNIKVYDGPRKMKPKPEAIQLEFF